MFNGERDGWAPGEAVPGQRQNGKPIESAACVNRSSDDLWQTAIDLFEAGHLTDQQMTIIDAKLQGFSNAEIADICSGHISTVSARLQEIYRTILDHENGDDD